MFTGETLAALYGGDAGTWRRKIRAAKEAYPDLPWDARGSLLKVMAVFDLHYPKHDDVLWNAMLDFIADAQPDVFIFGGDNLDCTPVSHWLENTRRPLELQRLVQDYRGFVSDILRPLTAVLPHTARKVWLHGNHEAWIDKYLDKHPEVEGLIEIENNLPLEDWEVLRYGEVFNIGKMHVTHGTYTNLHHAHKTAQVYGRNMVYGHLHTCQVHTMTTPLDSHSHMALAVPCACNMNPDYAKNRPNSWVTGFLWAYVYKNGYFNAYPVIATSGAFVAPNGVFYDGRRDSDD
jgi:hypothetical protein